MNVKPQISTSTGRNVIVQGKARSDDALGNKSQNTSGPEGAKEFGGLPNGWQRVKLGQVAEVIMGQAPRGDETNFEQRGTVFVKAGEFGPIRPVVREWTTRPLKFAKTGDVLICVVGATCGKLNLSIDCAIGRSVAALRPADQTFDNFLHFQLMPKVLTLRAGSTGSAQGVLSRDVLADIDLVLPPLHEQRRIVAEIEKQFTRLEAGVTALRRVQANLKRYRAAVLKAACEGKLVPTGAELQKSADRGRKGFEPGVRIPEPFETGEQLLQRILAERRKSWNGKGKYQEPAGPDTANLPPLPKGWTWATVEQLAAPEANSITDGPFGSNLKTEHYMATGPRVIRLQNIGDGGYADEEAHISQAHFDRLQKHRIFADDIVIAGFGENPPRSCIIPKTLGPAIVKADCIRFKPHSSVIPKYVNAALNSDPVRKRTKGMVHGVGRPRLNLGEIKSIVLPLPPPAEQTRIVAEVERRLSVVEELESVVSANLQRATRLRQSILQKAFTGELT